MLLGSLDELLGTPTDRELIAGLVAAGDLVAQERWIYRRQTAELEAELAARVLELVESAPSDRLSWEEGGESGGTELTAEQLSGVQNAASHRLSLITGGPGTGKTASLRAIAGVAAGRGVRVILVAPTGRAAIRMTEASGLRARTVHSALGWIPAKVPPTMSMIRCRATC